MKQIQIVLKLKLPAVFNYELALFIFIIAYECIEFVTAMESGLRSRSRSRPESVVFVGVGVGKFSSTPTPARSRSRLQHFLIIFFLVKMETTMETEHSC